MSYTRREFGKLALAGLPAAAVLGRTESHLRRVRAGEAELADQRRADRHDHLQLSQHDGSDRRSYAQVHPRLRHQRDRVDGRACVRALLARRSLPGAEAAVDAGPRARLEAVDRAAPQAGLLRPALLRQPPRVRPQSVRGTGSHVLRVAAAGAHPAAEAVAARSTPEQRAQQEEQAAKLKAWRTSVSMDAFKKLRKMYNDAGVTIYAWKQLNPNMSDEEFDYVFNVAEALGCTHTTLELPTNAAAS